MPRNHRWNPRHPAGSWNCEKPRGVGRNVGGHFAVCIARPCSGGMLWATWGSEFWSMTRESKLSKRETHSDSPFI